MENSTNTNTRTGRKAMPMRRKLTCCICGSTFYDYTGNNPRPVVDDDNAVCCSDCNSRYVIPARLSLLNDSADEKSNRKRIMSVLESLGWDDWSEQEREWYCYNIAALCHAYKVGARGEDAITAANQFLADHGRKPLPAGFPTIS